MDEQIHRRGSAGRTQLICWVGVFAATVGAGSPPAGACRGEEMRGEARSIRSNLAFPRAINSDVNWQVR